MFKLTIKKTFRNKANIIIMFIFTICFLTLISVLIFSKNYMHMQQEDFDKNIDGRTLLISPSSEVMDDLIAKKQPFSSYKYDYDAIKEIKHIQMVTDIEEFSGDTPFKSDKYNGKISFRVGNEEILPNNIKGEKFSDEDTGVAVCPYKFYPDDKELTSKTEYINGNTLLNTTFDFTYQAYDSDKQIYNKTKTFKIIGLYDTDMLLESHRTCFISKRDLQEINENTLKKMESCDDCLNSIFVIVDDINNLPTVKEKLTELGLQYVDKLFIDASAVSNLKIISYTSIIFVIVITIGITLVYIKKRNVLNTKEIGLFSSLGFSNKKIKIIYTIDILIIISLSFIMASLLSFIIYFIILKKYEIYFINVMYQPKLFFECYIIIYIVNILLTLIINYIFTSRSLRKSENYLMKEGI